MIAPPASIKAWTYSVRRIYPTRLWRLPLIDTPHDVANLDHIAVHNTPSLLLLRNAPPNEVCNTILVVLSLNGFATPIGFGIYRSLHIIPL